MITTMTYRRNEGDERRIARCARCDAIVFEEIASASLFDVNITCAFCGMMMLDLPIVDSDYFNVIMRVGRPLGVGARFRRAR